MAERENIRSRLKKHQLTQVWLINQLVERAKQGYMTKEEVDRCYESWKAHVGNESSKKRKSPGRRARRNCHNLIICMDQYYKNLWRESKCLDLSVQENSL